MMPSNKRIEKLRDLVEHHRQLYHTHDAPEISDEAYDALVRELSELENKHSLKSESPTQKIGGSVIDKFKKIKHQKPQWSYDNVFNSEELIKWDEKLGRFLEGVDYTGKRAYTAELKIDGLKIILTYKKGVLVQAATRGDGQIGEDITHNVMQIKSVPKNLNTKLDVVVVGEAWMKKSDLEKINIERSKNNEPVFANTRNAAAGSLRQLDASVTAGRNIQTFIYHIDSLTDETGTDLRPKKQTGILTWLKENKFSVNETFKLCENIYEVEKYYKKYVPLRDGFEYGVDGVVLKLEDIVLSESVGYTAKSPRFAVAYKFPAEEVTTILEDIVIQVGRTGAVTPVAHLKQVLVAGSRVSRATLHNMDEIQRLDVKIGDTVILKKAGDVIPEIIKTILELRTGKEKAFHMPKKCGECGSVLVQRKNSTGDTSVAYYCPNKYCPAQVLGQLIHFVSKKGLNIVGLGDKIIEKLIEQNIITNASDIFNIKKPDLVGLEKFGDKSADNTIASIENAKETTLARFIYSLGIHHVGEETAELIASVLEKPEDLLYIDSEKLVSIDGVGPTVAESVLDWVAEESHIKLYKNLLKVLKINIEKFKTTGVFSGKTFVLTGTLPTLSRDKAKDLIKKEGGKVASSVSKNTSYVLAGTDPGSKLIEAQKLGVQTIDEKTFQKMLK